jgi:hypothetical protein
MVSSVARRTMILPALVMGAPALWMPVLAAAQQSAPVIDSVTLREDDGGRYPVIYPEFHFHDSSGSVRFIHREVMGTDSPKAVIAHTDAAIDISATQQIRGATYVGGWHCGPESYYVTLRAFIMNLQGIKSNVVEYTIHCNAG